MTNAPGGGITLAKRVAATNPRETLYRWLVAAGCFALLVFFFSPAWAAFSTWARVPEMGGMIEVRRGVSVLQQVEHPGAPLVDPLHGSIQWRLLFPVVGKIFGLPSGALFGLADVGCLLALVMLVTILRRRGLDFLRCAFATTILGATSWFFTSTGWLGYYDSWVVLALLLVAFADARWPVWLACVWAPWIDERFVLAAPLALFCRYVDRTREGGAFDWKREAGLPAALLVAFVAVRLGVLAGRSGPNATPGGYLRAFNVLDTPITRIVFGVWSGLRAAWLFVFGAILLLSARHGTKAAILGLATLALVLVGVGTAQDFGRAMTFVLPVAVLGVVLAARESPVWWPRILPVGAALALLLPAHHVMSGTVQPIFYLYHQLSLYDAPPAAVMSETYELRAIREMQEGKLGPADQDLTLAIKLAANPAAAAKQRGVLRASQGRWKDAAEDFALMTKHEPENPDAWFMCAQSALALGDPSAARTNMEHALKVAPGDWNTRPDVARFQARLQQAK